MNDEDVAADVYIVSVYAKDTETTGCGNGSGGGYGGGKGRCRPPGGGDFGSSKEEIYGGIIDDANRYDTATGYTYGNNCTRVQSLHIRHRVRTGIRTACGLFVYGPTAEGDVTCMNCLVQRAL